MKRNSITDVFYASSIGFKVAPYLDFWHWHAFSICADGVGKEAAYTSCGKIKEVADHLEKNSGKQAGEQKESKDE